jgi:hypothetical protein
MNHRRTLSALTVKLVGTRILLAVALVAVTPVSQATLVTFIETLTAGAEVPPTASTGTGSATVTLDTVAQTLHIVMSFSGLTSGTTASHIHCCTTTPGAGNAGVATTTPSFTGFPLGVTSGTFDRVLDLTSASSYNPAFVMLEGGSVGGAEAALVAGMLAGETYLNIHTTNFPGGEIRGFLPRSVPEPATIALLGIAVAGLAMSRGGKRK